MSTFSPVLLVAALLGLILLLGLLFSIRPSTRQPRRQAPREYQFQAPLVREEDRLWQTLTAREKTVAQLAACGLSYQEIAAKLGIKYKTVDTHLQHIYFKLNVHSQVQLAHRYRDLVD